MNSAEQSGWGVLLAGLPNMTPQRLLALLRHHPVEHIAEVVQGERAPLGLAAMVLAESGLRGTWAAALRSASPVEAHQRCCAAGAWVRVWGYEGYPEHLLHDPLPPPVVFGRGDPNLLDGRRVAIVGTRNATHGGRQAARSIATDLAAAGVHVVSGLARGIDGAAHGGVLAAESVGRPIGVVGSAVDVVYPKEHRDLWAAVANCGLLLSEVPLGEGPLPWRFPMRNRIIAALAEVVVVVESREKGGSLITVTEALRRDVPVMAVPGAVGSRASAGTNQLLRDGASPVLDAGDVLAVLQLDHSRSLPGAVELRPRPRPDDQVLYRLIGDEPRTVDALSLAAALPLVETAMRLARLEADGWIAQADGWFECVGSPLK
jgi:DNA processing protein